MMFQRIVLREQEGVYSSKKIKIINVFREGILNIIVLDTRYFRTAYYTGITETDKQSKPNDNGMELYLEKFRWT